MTRVPSAAEILNRDCGCEVTDIAALHRDFERGLGSELAASLSQSHPHLFSTMPVFIDAAHLRDMQALVDAVQAVSKLPGYRDRALADAPDIAQTHTAAHGVFTAFDFHITPAGPRLIEINTNAGGALLNAAARRSQPPCCPDLEERFRAQPAADALEDTFVGMFRREWQLERGDLPLRTIAIVDEDPPRQYLYPEFLLFRELLQSHGLDACVVEARELEAGPDGLSHRGQQIDLVYNRLTDFYFERPEHSNLRRAYQEGSAVVTPHPRAHALLANKRNLVMLSDAGFLASLELEPAHLANLLRMVPGTVSVGNADEQWWADRKRWFFKPVDGYGGRGAYRGDKMTRRVFATLGQGRYVAQELTPPGERSRMRAATREAFKVDVRAYAYDGAIQLVAARLYQGQTTNFRSAGGGFAPIYLTTPVEGSVQPPRCQSLPR